MSIQDLRNAVAAGTITHEAAAAYAPDYQSRDLSTPAPAPTPFGGYSPQVAPTLRTVQDNELTSANLVKLGARGSPLIAQSTTRALEGANERGLLNTGMAQQSAEQGVIQSLLPIAGADANTYSNAASGNQSVQNQFGLQTNQYGFQGSQSALDRNQAKDLQAMNQNFSATQNEKANQQQRDILALNQSYMGGQAEKDRAARAGEFSQTLAKQNEQFYSQQGLYRDQLNWNMQQASTTLNTSAFNNYASSVTSILDGTSPDKANIIKKVNVIFFGNEDGTGDFKLKLNPTPSVGVQNAG